MIPTLTVLIVQALAISLVVLLAARRLVPLWVVIGCLAACVLLTGMFFMAARPVPNDLGTIVVERTPDLKDEGREECSRLLEMSDRIDLFSLTPGGEMRVKSALWDQLPESAQQVIRLCASADRAKGQDLTIVAE